jgi:hypothetical protein
MDTEHRDKPICPHCGYEETDAWEMDFGGLEGCEEFECGMCSEPFFCTKSVTISYSTKPINAKAGRIADQGEKL